MSIDYRINRKVMKFEFLY